MWGRYQAGQSVRNGQTLSPSQEYLEGLVYLVLLLGTRDHDLAAAEQREGSPESEVEVRWPQRLCRLCHLGDRCDRRWTPHPDSHPFEIAFNRYRANRCQSNMGQSDRDAVSTSTGDFPGHDTRVHPGEQSKNRSMDLPDEDEQYYFGLHHLVDEP